MIKERIKQISLAYKQVQVPKEERIFCDRSVKSGPNGVGVVSAAVARYNQRSQRNADLLGQNPEKEPKEEPNNPSFKGNADLLGQNPAKEPKEQPNNLSFKDELNRASTSHSPIVTSRFKLRYRSFPDELKGYFEHFPRTWDLDSRSKYFDTPLDLGASSKGYIAFCNIKDFCYQLISGLNPDLLKDLVFKLLDSYNTIQVYFEITPNPIVRENYRKIQEEVLDCMRLLITASSFDVGMRIIEHLYIYLLGLPKQDEDMEQDKTLYNVLKFLGSLYLKFPFSMSESKYMGSCYVEVPSTSDPSFSLAYIIIGLQANFLMYCTKFIAKGQYKYNEMLRFCLRKFLDGKDIRGKSVSMLISKSQYKALTIALVHLDEKAMLPAPQIVASKYKPFGSFPDELEGYFEHFPHTQLDLDPPSKAYSDFCKIKGFCYQLISGLNPNLLTDLVFKLLDSYNTIQGYFAITPNPIVRENYRKIQEEVLDCMRLLITTSSFDVAEYIIDSLYDWLVELPKQDEDIEQDKTLYNVLKFLSSLYLNFPFSASKYCIDSIKNEVNFLLYCIKLMPKGQNEYNEVLRCCLEKFLARKDTQRRSVSEFISESDYKALRVPLKQLEKKIL